MKVFLCLCLMAMVFLELPSDGDAKCCYTHSYNKIPYLKFKGKRCKDCYIPWTRRGNCGVGSCNIFGCNCDGGCRQGACAGETYTYLFGKRAVTEVEVEDVRDVIRAADADGDGRMSLREARAHLADVAAAPHLERSLRALDVNRDHFLSAREIDARGD